MITRWSAHRRGRHGLARTFQHSRSFRGLSVRENVEVAALGAGARARAARRRADELLERLQLTRVRGALRPVTLAHGDERRLGVARALATEPRFVLLDEPAAGLPEAEVPDFAAVIRSLRDDDDAGVLLIDHNMALVMEVCDRIQVLDHGATLAEGTPGEIRGEPRRGRRVPRRERRAGGRRMTFRVRDLAAAHGGVTAVHGVSFDVDAGEIVGLIGPNGAGKSTTLHAIVGLVGARSGEVELDGTIAGRTKPRVRSREPASRSSPRDGGSSAS